MTPEQLAELHAMLDAEIRSVWLLAMMYMRLANGDQISETCPPPSAWERRVAREFVALQFAQYDEAVAQKLQLVKEFGHAVV